MKKSHLLPSHPIPSLTGRIVLQIESVEPMEGVVCVHVQSVDGQIVRCQIKHIYIQVSVCLYLYECVCVYIYMYMFMYKMAWRAVQDNVVRCNVVQCGVIIELSGAVEHSKADRSKVKQNITLIISNIKHHLSISDFQILLRV